MSEDNQSTKEYKKLYRSSTNKKITGLLAGIAEYFAIDATIIRLGVAFVVLVTGVIPGVIFYFIASWIVPKEEEGKKDVKEVI